MIKRFSISNMLLFVTWIAIACGLVAPRLVRPPYQGNIHDLEGSTYYSYGLDEATATTIDSQIVHESPTWEPAEENPPVSARAALAIADRFRRKRLVDKHNWEWGLESLKLLPLDGKNNKWCWRVDFLAYPGDGGIVGRPPQMHVFVRMDGEVIVPESKSLDFFEEWGIPASEESSDVQNATSK